jgi:predicted ATP-grasp superfamily ATP-dependent carboligase
MTETERLVSTLRDPAYDHLRSPSSGVLTKDAADRVRSLLDRPILLVNADFYGTLAATRALGQAGISVYVASDRLLAASRWSRHVARTLRCPPLQDADRFVDWLGALGAREPDIVLYPTSDDATYLYALHAKQLSQFFLMYQPGLETTLHVLDKKRLYATAQKVGMEIPETWFPETETDVAKIARDVRMPVLVKPRTQVLSATHSKGVIVTERAQLVDRYRQFVRKTQYGRALLERMPDAGRPMIQTYLPEAAKGIFVLAAFINRDGSLFAARTGMKIFQRPRRLGVGLCFEEAALEQRVADLARHLARAVGYYGLFQLEFIKSGGKHLLIDFNPRFYNQLAFDMARGLPLSELVHAAACGATDQVSRLMAGAGDQAANGSLVFCNAFGLRFMLAAQRLTGQMTVDEARAWERWRDQHQGALIDPVSSPDDPIPAFVDVASQMYDYVRHPRAFARNVLLDGKI